jgi:hypothetical protein
VTVVDEILALLCQCSLQQKELILKELRKEVKIHPIESELNIVAEIILEAFHKDQGGLTFRMMRGVIAESAFEVEIISKFQGWKSITPEGDLPFDYLLTDGKGDVSVQVKLQRSKRHQPMMAKEANKNFSRSMFVVETQKTRGGIDSTTKEDTRPYRFGEFDILAVSMQPSTKMWDTFMYTVADWLIADPKNKQIILKFQPISSSPNEDWTDDIETCITWFRERRKKTIEH